MKIFFVSEADPNDVTQWSGIPYFMARALESAGLAVKSIHLRNEYALLLKAKQAFYQYGMGMRHLRDRDPLAMRSYRRQLREALARDTPDLMLCPGSLPVACLSVPISSIIWTDAVFGQMVDFYPSFSNLSESALKQGHALEAAALVRCSAAIFSSDWAAQGACQIYKADPAKIDVVSFGANIDRVMGFSEIERVVDARPRGTTRLVFIGLDWQRKGGDIALAIVSELRQRAVPVELVIVGSAPPAGWLPSGGIRFAGHISKASQGGRARLEEIISGSHFLLMPSRADCTPVAVSEANAFGVPCLASLVGGFPTIIEDHVNGYLFPLERFVGDCCEVIQRLRDDADEYRRLALSSFRMYQSRLNWRVAAERVAAILGRTVSRCADGAIHSAQGPR